MKSEIVGKAQQHQGLFENWEKLLFPKQFVERDEINTGFCQGGNFIISQRRAALHQGCNIVCGASPAESFFFDGQLQFVTLIKGGQGAWNEQLGQKIKI